MKTQILIRLNEKEYRKFKNAWRKLISIYGVDVTWNSFLKNALEKGIKK